MYLNSRFFSSTTIENSVELGLSQIHNLLIIMSSLVAQMVKNLPAVQETQAQFLGREDPLKKRMSSLQYSFLENSMDRGAWQSTGSERVRHD